MANKNEETETKKDVVVKPTMSNEEMEKFINENSSIVPRNYRKRFEVLTLEQKVERIRMYKDIHKVREIVFEKNKLENKIKVLFDRRKVTTEEVLKVIEFCKKYIEATKKEEINKLQNEINRLTRIKQTLENS